MSLHLALSTAHCPFFHFSHLLILVVPQIVIYHIYTYIIKSRVHMAVFCLFCCPISFLSLLKVLHQRENIRCLPFWVIFILQLNKTPLCVYIQLQPFICRWPSRLVSRKTSRVSLLPSPTTGAGSPSHVVKERADDHLYSETCLLVGSYSVLPPCLRHNACCFYPQFRFSIYIFPPLSLCSV